MYPTGGYGNFLYYLLTVYLADTVKIEHSNFNFNSNGNSHNFPKYTETFSLSRQNLKNFNYSYTVQEDYRQQIVNGKKFLVLADVGNRGDNIRFVKRYFPHAVVIRTYAKSFEEKLLVWYNCVSKTSVSSNIYKDSLHTHSGIASFVNKDLDRVTDLDAIECDLNFFKNDFDSYGKFFNDEISEAINIPIKSFFNSQDIVDTCKLIATKLSTQVINIEQLKILADKFISSQSGLALLKNYNTMDTLAAQALKRWYETC